ncbi:MAG: hypothetical protein H6732_09370 [Alphaproteobacteria bacterium]|nr:hypothetical protein [Alphaproteobacteria bacterium]
MLPSLLCCALALAAEAPAPPEPAEPTPEVPEVRRKGSLIVDEVQRGRFHFQILFGLGGGEDSEGLHHAMEIGGTFRRNGVTLALLHTFVQNKGFLRDKGGPDLIGGWLFACKVPLWRPEIVAKLAVGPGGLHDQSDGIRAILGVGMAYGLDLHLPFSRRVGLTLGLTGFHTVVPEQGRHYATMSLGLGFTVF